MEEERKQWEKWTDDADVDMVDKICAYLDHPSGRKWMEVREKMLQFLNALKGYEQDSDAGLKFDIKIVANSSNSGWCVSFKDESAGYSEGGSETISEDSAHFELNEVLVPGSESYLEWARYEFLIVPGMRIHAHQMEQEWEDDDLGLSAKPGDYLVRYDDGNYAVYDQKDFVKYHRLLLDEISSQRLGRVTVKFPVSAFAEGTDITGKAVLRGMVTGSALIPGYEDEERLIVVLDDTLLTTYGIRLNSIVVLRKYVTYDEAPH